MNIHLKMYIVYTYRKSKNLKPVNGKNIYFYFVIKLCDYFKSSKK